MCNTFLFMLSIFRYKDHCSRKVLLHPSSCLKYIGVNIDNRFKFNHISSARKKIRVQGG